MSELLVVSDPEWNAERHNKALCDYVGEPLARTYPGYRWRVEVKGGLIDIRCEHATGRAGYTFNIAKNGLPDRKAIMLAGGEILERFHLGRRGFSEDAYRSLPRWCGQLLPDW
jgi:hypothetical protein